MEILAKEEVRIWAQYGNLCELQITRNISWEQRIESRTNYSIWIELSKKIAFIDDFRIFAFFVKFRVCFCKDCGKGLVLIRH